MAACHARGLQQNPRHTQHQTLASLSRQLQQVQRCLQALHQQRCRHDKEACMRAGEQASKQAAA
jgi:hypothetical protein